METVLPIMAFIDGLGAPEMGLIFVLVLLLFGGQKLPEFARGLGKSIREFKKAAAGVEEEFKRALEEDERKRAATPAIMPPQTVAPSPAPVLVEPVLPATETAPLPPEAHAETAVPAGEFAPVPAKPDAPLPDAGARPKTS